MMWMHNVRTYARTVGLGGEGRRVVKNSLKIFHTSAGDCPAVVVCCGRGVLFGDALDNFDARTDLDTRDARAGLDARSGLDARNDLDVRAVSGATASRAFSCRFTTVCPTSVRSSFFGCSPAPPPPGRCVRYLRRKRPFLFVFSPVAAAFGCLSDPVLFFLGIFAY